MVIVTDSMWKAMHQFRHELCSWWEYEDSSSLFTKIQLYFLQQKDLYPQILTLLPPDLSANKLATMVFNTPIFLGHLTLLSKLTPPCG